MSLPNIRSTYKINSIHFSTLATTAYKLFFKRDTSYNNKTKPKNENLKKNKQTRKHNKPTNKPKTL